MPLKKPLKPIMPAYLSNMNNIIYYFIFLVKFFIIILYFIL